MEMSDDILKSIDNYIEFAEARKAFSDVGAYTRWKKHIESLQTEVAELKQRIYRCGGCGKDWFDYGGPLECPHCQLTALRDGIKGLSEQWREDEEREPPYDSARNGNDCADELDALRKKHDALEEKAEKHS